MRVFMLPAALCLLLTLPVAGSAQAQGETIGQIVRWRGTVEVIGPGSPRAVLVGEPVREGEELVTGRDSQVDVAFRDGARLILGPDSHIVLSTYPPTPGDRVVRLLAGIVRVFLAFDGDKDFAVKTATAVAAARSTIWLVALEEKAGLAREFGADEVILYTQIDFEAETNRLTDGEGVNVVYDSVGRTTFDKGLNCLKPRGYMVLYGASSGPAPPLDPQVLVRKGSLFLTRPSLAHYSADREEILRRSGDLFEWMSASQLQVRVNQAYPLADAAEAHRYLEGRKTRGKLLLMP